jgi:hypothetical protein
MTRSGIWCDVHSGVFVTVHILQEACWLLDNYALSTDCESKTTQTFPHSRPCGQDWYRAFRPSALYYVSGCILHLTRANT